MPLRSFKSTHHRRLHEVPGHKKQPSNTSEYMEEAINEKNITKIIIF